MSLERLYRLGYGFTRQERRTAYEDALENGKEIATMLLNGLRHRKASQKALPLMALLCATIYCRVSFPAGSDLPGSRR